MQDKNDYIIMEKQIQGYSALMRACLYQLIDLDQDIHRAIAYYDSELAYRHHILQENKK